jgi:hypothetical protein
MRRLLSALLALTAIPPFNAAQVIDDASLRMPSADDYAARLLTSSLIELTYISSPPAGAAPIPLPGKFRPEDFRVSVDGAPVTVAKLGFKRRALYAPLKERDLRVATNVYLELATPLNPSNTHAISISPADGGLWPANLALAADTNPQRFNPAIHVNQEGYAPDFPKIAMIGYFLGSLGELRVPLESGFELVDAKTGECAFRGRLLPRRDVGFTSAPKPYQAVLEANFTAFNKPGEYRLLVPGLGASYPFRIHDGELMNFVRAYALGLYHQRCGCTNSLPYTRFIHDACHTAPAEVPTPASSFRKTWDIIAKLDEGNATGEQRPPQLKSESAQFFPVVRKGKIDTTGGHHDAGDYSKYTINSATLVNVLMFAVDSLPGVADLDNLGLPESGDGISDLLQEAKWESDYLAKLQDDDGGFYFLVYPKERRYESGVTPDRGDAQVVWPKNTAVTAAAVAALAQCASSPHFKKHFPADAKRYFAQAERGWKFLMAALQKYGDRGAYQKLTHYGDHFKDADEIAWAACEMFLATGDPTFQAKLVEWYPNPADPKTHYWSWWHASFSYGAALRSYAFAARSGRLPAEKLDAAYLAQCEAELRRAAEDALRWSQQNAYGTSYPEAPKRQRNAGWYFASDQAFDLTVGYQLRPRPEYTDAVLMNLNFEAGCNPNNVSFITGVGQRRQREIVHQYAQADRRVLPPSGIPLGSLQTGFDFIGHYKTELRQLSYPADDANVLPFPLYDHWGDAYNVSTEFVINNQARSIASLAFWAAQTPMKSQAWKSAPANIILPDSNADLNRTLTVRLESPDLDLTDARVVWEARDHEPAFGTTFKVTPRHAGPQWIEAEACLPDGRRVFAAAEYSASSPVVFWVDGSLPKGATPIKLGGDEWNWMKPISKPAGFASRSSALQHQSSVGNAIHEHGFNDAEASLFVEPGDVLFAYVFLDPKNPPKTIMLEWNDGRTWEHRAYWGLNLIPYGKGNTTSQRNMGPLPATGKWVRLEIPANTVGLEGVEVKGMIFRLHSGRATWDAAGKMSKAAKEKGLTAAIEAAP